MTRRPRLVRLRRVKLPGLLGKMLTGPFSARKAPKRRVMPEIAMCPPPELAGQWVAWSEAGQIVAHGDTLDEVVGVAERTTGGRVSYERLDPIPDGTEAVRV